MSSVLRHAVLIFLLLLSPAPAHAEGPRKPNILILLADDLGYADVGFQGCTDFPTPNLDALAKAGVRCTSGYVSGPYCSPTRAGLLTGRYQQRFGHEFNPGAGANVGLPLTETTLADRLKAAGYVTGLVGKWHLGEADRFRPPHRGFDESYGFLAGAHPYFPGQGAPIYRGLEVARETEYLTDAFAREACAFLDRHQARPFFLYLAFNAVHTPMHATPDRVRRFESIGDPQRRTYAGMTVALDEAVGRVLDKLRALKLEDDTLVFFFSDNGGPTMRGTTINGSRNTPLRGSKRTTLEGGIRVPFVVRWPGKLPAGRVYDAPVIQLDILPTVLAAAGVTPRPEWNLDGVDLVPFLSGKESRRPHETLYWRLGAQTAVRHGDWKLVRYDPVADGANPTGPRRAAITATPAKLYDLAHDIGEVRDLAAQQPAKAKELEELWQKWSAQMARPLWGQGARGSAQEETD